MKHSYKKVLGLICSLCIGTVFAGCSFGEQQISDLIGTGSDAVYYITPTTGAADKSIVTDLSECKDESILILVSSYYLALENGTASDLIPLVTDSSAISDETFDKFSDIETATVKKIYYMDGVSPVDKILFVYSELEIEGISATIPSLDELYISQAEDGSWLIVNGSISTSVYSQIKDLTNCEGVDNLTNSINLKFNKALEEDSALNEYFTSEAYNHQSDDESDDGTKE
jgi:hypothetical protein